MAMAVAWMAGLVAPGVTIPLVGLVFFRRPGVAALAMAACAAGALAMAEARLPPVAPRAGVLEGVVVRPPEDEPGGARRTIIELDDGVRVLVLERAPRIDIFGGERVRFTGRAAQPPPPGIDGAFDRARFLEGRGIRLTAMAEAPGLTIVDQPARSSVWRLAGQTRARAAAALAASSSGEGAGLVQALVLGRRADVSPELEEDFRRAGVSHVLSVSGVHLATVTWLVYALACALARRSARLTSRFSARSVAAVAAMPVAVAYTFVTGAEVATVRALFCALVVLGAAALGRRSDGLTALAAAALVIMAGAPLVIHEPSFQLSFAAAAGLALVAPRLRGRGRILKALGASLAATLATAPFTALAFGVVQPGGILANLIVVPLAELIILPLGLLGAVLGLVTPALGASFAALAGLAATGLARLVHFLATLLPVWEVPPPRPLELLITSAVALALLVFPWRRALGAAALAALLFTTSFVADPLPSALTVTFLDVGQGDAALIETPAGERWLIDAGGRLHDGARGDPGEAVRRALAAKRIGSLDLVVVSHPHPDHYGGLATLSRHVPIRTVWVNGDDPADPRWEALRATLPTVTVTAGELHEAGAARLEVLAPAAPDPLRGVNDNSLVIRLSLAGRRLLFPGDLERAGEEALTGLDLAADVVKVPHHGSRTSSTEPFVRATAPRLAVVSCGRDNHFGFPAAEVVERWQAAGAEVVRIDERGSVTVRVAEDGTINWTTFR